MVGVVGEVVVAVVGEAVVAVVGEVVVSVVGEDVVAVVGEVVVGVMGEVGSQSMFTGFATFMQFDRRCQKCQPSASPWSQGGQKR